MYVLENKDWALVPDLLMVVPRNGSNLCSSFLWRGDDSEKIVGSAIEREVVGLGGNVGVEAGSCTEAGNSGVAARAFEAESIGYMQQQEEGCSGCIAWNAALKHSAEPGWTCE